MEELIPPQGRRILELARVGHLATADARGRPHLIPAVFVLEQGRIYTPIDGKPKGDPRRLRRILNIQANPQVAFLVDHYEEDWTKIGYVLIRGLAALLAGEMRGPQESSGDTLREYQRAEELLRRKYPQYRSTPVGGPEGLLIRISPERCTVWGRL